ncbi:MAG: methyl-accepting chemotaxis protein, partial [Gammaproteobacteria bacterium]
SGQFNQFVEHLLEMVKGISNGVQCMNSSIRYFNQTGHNIKSNAYLQSKQTDNMVTEIDTMSQTVHGIACDSEEAELIAQTSKESAEAGLHVVEQTINGMKFLSETVGQSSHQLQTLSSSFDTIDSFVVSINSIAEQTNLLALNAAIEAARAGNHGRGFAVVADEVRALATRTGQTTVEINKLINTMRSNMNDLVQALSSSIEQVTQGVALSQTAGETLQEIVEHSQEVAEKIHKIKYKVNHQLDIADKVKTEVNTIAKLAHQNGDAVAQVVNFSEQLSQQMDSIQHIVDDFKIQ